MLEEKRKHTAYHEAGHAAAQLILGQTPTLVTISPVGGTLGSCHHIAGDEFTEEGIRHLVINLYGGREAETRVGGDGEGSWSDNEEAEPYLTTLGIKEKEMREATAEFVSKHWLLIERIACELLRYTTLGMEELDTLLGIYRGEETEEDLREYRNCFGAQKQIEEFLSQGCARTDIATSKRSP